MREIKFRAWDREDLRMVERPFVVSNEGKAFDEYRGGGYVKQYTLMQYTGLKDKNGKEIYEGDILKIPNGGISEVKWNYGEWNVEDFMNNAGSNNIYNFLQSEIEIIGNIYENPELLK